MVSGAKKKGRAPEITRSMPDDLRRPLAQHAAIVGQVVWASNHLHTYFLLIFRWTIGDDETANAIWHAQKNDKPQLELLAAALKATKRTDFTPTQKERITWAIKCAFKLAEHRNDLIHLPMSLASSYDSRGRRRTILLPSLVATPPARLGRVTLPTWRQSLKLVRGDLYSLAKYISLVWLRLADHPLGRSPLPRRPRLRSIPKETGRPHPTTPKRARHT